MDIKNLVASWRQHALAGGDVQAYIQSFPELFDHYFTFWSDPMLPFFSEEATIDAAAKRILDRLPMIEAAFVRHGMLLEHMHMVLFVGQNMTNGHAAKFGNDWWVWIPVEFYTSDVRVDAFVAHEMVHALQYAEHPDLYFSNVVQKEMMSRQCLTEGVAMRVAQEVLLLSNKETLWADVLSDEAYEQFRCHYQEQKKELMQSLERHWTGRAGELFQANEPKDIFRFRGGYAAMLEMMQDVYKTTSVQELIALQAEELEESILSWIKKKAR